MEIYLNKVPESINDLNIIEMTDKKVVVDINDVTIPYVKTFTDVLLTKIPTMAIDTIEFKKNTSSLVYELIADRLGFIPIKANPDNFEYFDGKYTEHNTLVFSLNKSGPSWNDIIVNPNLMDVMSGDLKWVPFEDIAQINFDRTPDYNQRDKFKDDPIRVVDENYVILKLRPGEDLDVMCYCLKGTNKFHAKFSPIAALRSRKLGEIGKVEGTNLNLLAINYEQPTVTPNIYVEKYIEQQIATYDITIAEYSLLYPKFNFRFEFELIGQVSGEYVLDKAVKITKDYINLPYSERMEELLPGYLY